MAVLTSYKTTGSNTKSGGIPDCIEIHPKAYSPMFDAVKSLISSEANFCETLAQSAYQKPLFVR